MIRLYNFKEWAEIAIQNKLKCEADKTVLCSPSESDVKCVFCYETYVYNAINSKFRMNN